MQLAEVGFIHESHQFFALNFPANKEVVLKYNNQLLVYRNQSNCKKVKNNFNLQLSTNQLTTRSNKHLYRQNNPLSGQLNFAISKWMCVMSNQTCAALLFDFEIMYIISDQIALYSIQLPLLIRILQPDQSVSKILHHSFDMFTKIMESSQKKCHGCY